MCTRQTKKRTRLALDGLSPDSHITLLCARDTVTCNDPTIPFRSSTWYSILFLTFILCWLVIGALFFLSFKLHKLFKITCWSLRGFSEPWTLQWLLMGGWQPWSCMALTSLSTWSTFPPWWVGPQVQSFFSFLGTWLDFGLGNWTWAWQFIQIIKITLSVFSDQILKNGYNNVLFFLMACIISVDGIIDPPAWGVRARCYAGSRCQWHVTGMQRLVTWQ